VSLGSRIAETVTAGTGWPVFILPWPAFYAGSFDL
jgi:hypothetical protein